MAFFKKLFSAGLVAAATWGVSAQAADITIGALFPLSGHSAIYADVFGSGSNLAIEHINADKMLDGKLSIQYEDSQGLPQPGLVGMNKLVNVTKAPYVLSAFTGVSKAISTTASRTKTIAINGGGVGPDLAELGPYFWNIIPLANFEVSALLPYLVKERNAKRFVLVYIDDPLGAAIMKEMRTTLGKVGGELVETLSITAQTQQFAGIAARIRAANPDVIYIASYGVQQAQMVKQFRDNGVNAQLVSYGALDIPQIQSMPEAKGALYTSQAIDWDSTDPVTKRFVDDYKAKHNKMPSIYTANYYNAVRLFGLLAQELQKQGKPINGDNLLAQRKATKTFDLVGGPVTFAENGTVVAPIQINEVDGSGGRVVMTVDN